MIEIKGVYHHYASWEGKWIDDSYHFHVHPDVIRAVEWYSDYAYIYLSIWGNEKPLKVDLDMARNVVKQCDILMAGRINS